MKDFIKLIVTVSLHSTLESCGATPRRYINPPHDPLAARPVR
jgi:hypothetical protein